MSRAEGLPVFRISIGLIAIVLLAADDPDQPARKITDDLALLQGIWEFQSLEIEGKKLPLETFKSSRIEIDGNRFTSTMGVIYKGTIKIDAARKPKTIDMTFTEGPEKGNTARGIYELTGDTWKLCLPLGVQERPREFATRPGSGLALESLTKRKPADPAPARPKPPG